MHRLDEAQIKAFAIQFDPQPFHTDNQAAERTFFKGLAASGWLSLSETSSGWRLTENRAMLLFNDGSFQAHWLDV